MHKESECERKHKGRSCAGCLKARPLAAALDSEHLECSLQPSPPGCFTKKLSEARGNGIGFVTAG